MKNYSEEGTSIRESAKNLVYEFMTNHIDCKPFREGLKQATIFRECGFDWGNKLKATSSNQQYWIVGLLRQLEEEGKVQQDTMSKKWRLTE